MKKITYIVLILSLFSCSKRFKPKTYENEYSELTELNSKDTLFRVSKNEFYEMGDEYFSPLIVRSDILNFKTNIFEI